MGSTRRCVASRGTLIGPSYFLATTRDALDTTGVSQEVELSLLVYYLEGEDRDVQEE